MKKMLIGLLMFGTGVVWAAEPAQQVSTEAAEDETAIAPVPDPDGVTVKRGIGGEVQEYRIGGRLDSMTIDRDRGTTDYWYDRSDDSTWETSQGEVGEKENLRQWKIGDW